MTQTTQLKNNKKHRNVMEYLFNAAPLENYKINDLVEGAVLSREKLALYINLGTAIGAVYGKNYIESRDLIKNLIIGDKVTVKIIDLETPEGFIALSLKEAGKEAVWREAEERLADRLPLNASVIAANKGGLILEWSGLSGFLPASHLKPEHYPRVEGGDKDKIYEELKNLTGKVLTVTIVDINQKDETLIFSEKNVRDETAKTAMLKYQIGDTVEGTVNGIVDFGIFIKLEEGIEGLAHISELDWSLVENPGDLFKVGDQVKAKITSIDNEKISLSVKALKVDPWEEIKDQYHKGDIVSGVVIRFNRHGALVSLKEGVAGLIHISEFGNEKVMKSKLELGKSYHFQITFFSPAEHRLTFSFLDEEK